MKLITFVSICAALAIYFDAEKLKIKPWKWCIFAFISCYVTYVLLHLTIGFTLLTLNYYQNGWLNFALEMSTYAAALITLRPISKKMRRSAENETNDFTFATDEKPFRVAQEQNHMTKE